MTTMQRRLAGWAEMLLLATLAVAGGVRAQDTDVDPPGRVARLSEVNGQVWLYSPDGAEWIVASRNQPLTTGDRLATEAGARAELQIGSTTVRVDASSEIEVVQLDDEHVALELHDGSAIAHVRDLNGAGQLELTTEEGRFVTLRTGTYRFDRNNGKSDVTVYSGQARYEGPNSGLPVNAGQRAEFWIDSGGVAQYSTLSPVNDAFASWSSERDRRVVGNIAERYVSPEMTGAAELDAYGRWEQTPDYGSVWIPTAVAADWAPYSQGRWTFVRPWGWTWVDDAPWGFAPFHYGRWVYLRNNWCWTPGTRVARPIYAPALVGWVGGARGNVSVTIGGGPAVGWFPLAPREVYVPSYRVSPRYARNVNITHVSNVTVINNVFANPQGPREFENRRFPRAITVVPSSVMAERRPVGPAAAQYRQTPGAREFANQPGRSAAMLAPPIATPPMPARSADPRGVRPPPGARPDAGGDRPGFAGRPGFAPRDRERGNEAERDRDRRSSPQPQQQIRPQQQAAPQASPPAAPPPGALPHAPGRPPTQFEPGNRRPDLDGAGRPPRERDRGSFNEPVSRPPVAQPQPPAPQSIRPQVTAPPVQEAPMMRPLPVQRGEDRRDERRSEERRLPPRPETPMPPQVEPQRPTPRVERPAPPAVPQVVAPRPVEVQRPAAPPAPRAEPPRPETVRPSRPPEPRGDEQKRGEPREPR
ncbi:MAG: DUF6600 domain-containing protein [Burkholderiales bacterium]